MNPVRIDEGQRGGPSIVAVSLLLLVAVSCSSTTAENKGPSATAVQATASTHTAPQSVPPLEPDGRRDLGRVLFVGDSITLTAQDDLEYEFRERFDGTPEFIAVGGTAPCDVVEMIGAAMRRTPPETPPDLLVMEWYGNNLTPCVGMSEGDSAGFTIGSVEFMDAYYEAFVRIAAEAREHGITVVWATPPPRHPDAPAPDLFNHLESMARGFGWHVVRAGDAVSDGGAWTEDMSCLPSEKEQPACIEGMIRVRSADQVHFETFGDDVPGARRWAKALIEGL